MKLFRIAIGVLFCGIAGCAFRPDEAPSEAKSLVAQMSGDEPLVSWKLVGQPEPHKYSVQWRLKDLGLARGLRLRRESDPGQFNEAEVAVDESGGGIDDQVIEDQVYRYELVSNTGPSGAPVSLGRWTVKVPRDEVVEGVRDISSLVPQGHRLFLKPDAVLRTQGVDRTLEFDEIHSEGATLETFAADATAAPGTAGRAGGYLKIQAQRASGRLRIVMRGEAGGLGASGGNGARGAAGGKGVQGIFHRALDGCIRQPGAGQRGANGEGGGKGGAGFSGGSSGAFEFVLIEASPFEVEPVLEGGRGGSGGPGGPGGPGGAGGPGGEISVVGSLFPIPVPFPGSVRPCRPAPSGPSGAAGPQGPVGDAGAVGATENYCVRIGERSFGQCI